MWGDGVPDAVIQSNKLQVCYLWGLFLYFCFPFPLMMKSIQYPLHDAATTMLLFGKCDAQHYDQYALFLPYKTSETLGWWIPVGCHLPFYSLVAQSTQPAIKATILAQHWMDHLSSGSFIPFLQTNHSFFYLPQQGLSLFAYFGLIAL